MMESLAAIHWKTTIVWVLIAILSWLLWRNRNNLEPFAIRLRAAIRHGGASKGFFAVVFFIAADIADWGSERIESWFGSYYTTTFRWGVENGPWVLLSGVALWWFIDVIRIYRVKSRSPSEPYTIADHELRPAWPHEVQIVFDMSKEIWGVDTTPLEQMKLLHNRNPETMLVLANKVSGEISGFSEIYPVTNSFGDAYAKGRRNEIDINEEAIRLRNLKKQTSCLIVVTVALAARHRGNPVYFNDLQRRLVDYFLESYFLFRDRPVRILAAAYVEIGEKMCAQFKMKPNGKIMPYGGSAAPIYEAILDRKALVRIRNNIR